MTVEQSTLKAVTDSYKNAINYRLMRPLASRFKLDFVYHFPTNTEGLVVLETENPMKLPVLQFSALAIQVEYAAIMPTLNFLYANKNVFSASLPTQMRFAVVNPEVVGADKQEQIHIINGTLDLSINEMSHNHPETNEVVNEDIVCFQFTFGTAHDNLIYVANIDVQDFINQALTATSHKEFQG